MGTLHAGATSAFFECATTWTLYPIARAPDFWASLGICRTIAFTYLRPAVEGEVLLMECEVSSTCYCSKASSRADGGGVDGACWEADRYVAGSLAAGERWGGVGYV